MDFIDFIHNQKIVGLSPMDGITDEPYRLTLNQYSKPDVYFTEFVSAEGLAHSAVKLYDPLLYRSFEHPIIGQLFGKDPESYYKSAVILCHLGFDGIDINMGCPAHTVTQHGSGAALIKKPELASEIINSVKFAINDYLDGKVTINDLNLKEKTIKTIEANRRYSDYNLENTRLRPTLSVKTRTGIDAPIVNQWISHLLSHKLDFLTLHGRTLKQGYSGSADWQLIKQAKELSLGTDTLVWGNGDVSNREEADKYFKNYQVDGLLIGRSTMGNPWAFLKQQYTPSLQDRFSAMFYHSQIFVELFPKRRFEIMRRHYLSYISGIPYATSLRSKLVTVNSLSDLEKIENEFVSEAGI